MRVYICYRKLSYKLSTKSKFNRINRAQQINLRKKVKKIFEHPKLLNTIKKMFLKKNILILLQSS